MYNFRVEYSLTKRLSNSVDNVGALQVVNNALISVGVNGIRRNQCEVCMFSETDSLQVF